MKRHLGILLFSILPSFAQLPQISGDLTTQVWVSDDIPAGFFEFDEGAFFAPQLSINLDYQYNSQIYTHANISIDRGFDPGTEPDGEIRIDQLYLHFSPFGDNSLNIQVGKFGTIVGSGTYLYSESPFLLSPLPYSSIIGVNSQNLAALSSQEIENRANQGGTVLQTEKTNWSSVIWGQSLSNGAAIYGNINTIDYALEIKNTGLGSTPEEWDFGEGDFSDPLFATRIGYRPNAAWNLGISASRGPFLDADTFSSANLGIDRGDFNQSLFGIDVRWAYRNWVITGEAFYSIYNRAGEDLESLSYYLETTYNVSPGFSMAARIAQSVTNEVSIPSGGTAPWSPDLLRGELAVSYRFTPDLIMQAHYAYTYNTNDFSPPEPHLFGFSTSFKF